ncbi:murein transglycosylase domain-containing protein [Hydrogenimonas thermophila]|uniref:murein transglycosylase domain-containing protein n=1 Tax=Hydrogenimonas thermophila TaxID=223786 RepID=UPI002936E6CF|nr:murein transglycosylase domain-containing protein [Hydrogenimonas thermophila]WOE69556.1 murein transglycosylase domain-containing protein [Hydrogenimonas thermophila]WOE72070.1 murein transglycosylase domain-containing protein [Hydrogenimonas thermophila]
MFKKLYIFIVISILLSGCASSDYTQIAQIALSKDPNAAVKSFATRKSIKYVRNPKKFEKDIKSFVADIEKFLNTVSKNWGKRNVKKPSRTKYVKYLQNYRSRAEIDFDRGIVTVETLDYKTPTTSLKKAIVTTLLTPEDPRGVDLYSAKPVKIGGKPYLYQEVLDHQNKAILYRWRAENFAKYLTKNRLQKKYIIKNGKRVPVHFVKIRMVKDHEKVRVKKFKPYIERFARRYNISKNLVYAIIKTESDFNQYAVSSAGAFGLMQIVPKTAGRDAYKHAKKRSWTPTRQYLFNAKNNIELGCAYLNLLNFKYLGKIRNPVSREYCVISAYNTGSGNVLRTFSKSRDRAFRIINSKTPSQVYTKLKTSMPYKEARRYLVKVLNHKKEFIRL